MPRRNPPQTLPNSGTPGEQALVTPAARPEVLLALQHQHATVALHQECADIRQLIGGLQSDIAGLRTDTAALKADIGQNAAKISELRHLRSKLVGGGAVLALLLTSVIGLAWYFVGPKWATLSDMADEYRVHKADEEKAKHQPLLNGT